jgi:hypothetical protein
MRLAGLRADAEGIEDDDALEIAVKRWVGDQENGQSGYYRKKAERSSKLLTQTKFVSLVCLFGGIMVALALAFFSTQLDSNYISSLLVLMGILPLAAATREAYSQKKAEKELIRQYQFMHQIFSKASRKLEQTADAGKKREILRAVGEVALDEHAEWLLMHRERSLEIGRL